MQREDGKIYARVQTDNGQTRTHAHAFSPLCLSLSRALALSPSLHAPTAPALESDTQSPCPPSRRLQKPRHGLKKSVRSRGGKSTAGTTGGRKSSLLAAAKQLSACALSRTLSLAVRPLLKNLSSRNLFFFKVDKLFAQKVSFIM